MDIKYTKAKYNDINAIVKMQHKLNDMTGVYEELDDKTLKDYLEQSIEGDEAVYYVAKSQNEDIGMICIDFSDCLDAGDIEYCASIPLIYVNESLRGGEVAYTLFKLALDEIKNRGLNSFLMTVEDNNPNKYLHFSIADKLIEQRNEDLVNGNEISQYLLGVSNIDSIYNLSMKEFGRKAVYAKRNFDKILQDLNYEENIYNK